MLVGLVLALLFGVVWTVRVLTHPPRRAAGWAIARGLPSAPGEMDRPLEVRTWGLKFEGTILPVWECRGRRADGRAVVLTHGWGDSRYTMLGRVDRLADVCSRVIVWDMPGHGEAPGTCSLGVREVGALVSLVHELTDVERVVLYGYSLGAGVSIAAACELGDVVEGVIAEAPYRLAVTPARNVIRGAGMPWRWNVPVAFWWLGWRLGVGGGWNGFDRTVLAGRLKTERQSPLLVLHGEQDWVCPVEDGQEIAAAGGGEFVLVPEAGHLDLWESPAVDVTWAAVARFWAR